MDPLEIVKLRSFMSVNEGSEDITIGLIDGPIDLTNSILKNAKVRVTGSTKSISCERCSRLACIHATFVAAILVGSRTSAAPAICPKCRIISRPIFCEVSHDNSSTGDQYFPTSSPKELSDAIIEIVDAGVDLINLSIGISSSSIVKFHELQQAYEYAMQKNVLILGAAGNQASLGYASDLYSTWIIPVAACDEEGKISSLSNIGPSIGKRGLMAPGVNIISALSGGTLTRMSGTSCAVPFVTGGIALLWSQFPQATVTEIISSILQTDNNVHIGYRRSIVPVLFNGEASSEHLAKIYGTQLVKRTKR